MPRSFLFALLVFFPLFVPMPATGAGPEEREVLILHSYNMGQPWTDGIMAGMQKAFGAHPGIHLEVEYMDTRRYHDPAYLTRVLDTVLSYKLRRHFFDLVLLSDNDALRFALRHRDDLFADTPIVFCGVNNFRPEMIEGYSDVTGVAEYPDFRGNMELIARLHPDVRRVVVIGGVRNETDRENRRAFQSALPTIPRRLEVTFWDNVPWGELRGRLGGVGKGTVVFISGLVQEADGDIVPFGEVIREIHKRAPSVPVYSAWDFLLGEGVVGGLVVSSRRQGYLGGELALKVLSGQDADTLPVVTRGTNLYMFDYRELKRAGIPLEALPPGSTVVNRPPPFLNLSRQEVWILAGLSVVLLGTLAALLVAMVRQRRAEEELRESEERFRAIADFTYDWEVWTGTDGQLKWINPSVEHHTGYTPAECLAMADYPRPLLCEEDADEVMRVFRAALEERTAGSDLVFRIRRRDGESRCMAASWYPIYNARGEYLGLRSSMRDVTERQAALAHLREVNEELDAFVRTVSHDLRSHLTPVIGFADFLLREYGGSLDVTGREALGEIVRQGQRMHAMLEDLLALARVGYAETPPEPVDSAEVVRDVLITLTPRLAETGGRVKLEGELPKVYIPRFYLVQALENLLGNAVRYGSRGGPIEVGAAAGKERVCFFVRDHGPGVPDAEKERVFDLFYRGSSGRDKAGTGVGLATVRRIARRCGGRTWVEDTPGGGATFWLEVESAPPQGGGESGGSLS